MAVIVYKLVDEEAKQQGEHFDDEKATDIVRMYGADGLRARGPDGQPTGPTYMGDRAVPAGNYVLVFAPAAPGHLNSSLFFYF